MIVYFTYLDHEIVLFGKPIDCYELVMCKVEEFGNWGPDSKECVHFQISMPIESGKPLLILGNVIFKNVILS